jgi:hypothetical protein
MGKNDDPNAPYRLYDGDVRIGTYLRALKLDERNKN